MGDSLCSAPSPYEINSRLLSIADKYRDRGVVALDLAGNEKISCGSIELVQKSSQYGDSIYYPCRRSGRRL